MQIEDENSQPKSEEDEESLVQDRDGGKQGGQDSQGEGVGSDGENSDLIQVTPVDETRQN